MVKAGDAVPNATFKTPSLEDLSTDELFKGKKVPESKACRWFSSGQAIVLAVLASMCCQPLPCPALRRSWSLLSQAPLPPHAGLHVKTWSGTTCCTTCAFGPWQQIDNDGSALRH